MKILVDEMPSHQMDCPHAELSGNIEYKWWVIMEIVDVKIPISVHSL
jgi:hypothetical protein